MSAGDRLIVTVLLFLKLTTRPLTAPLRNWCCNRGTLKLILIFHLLLGHNLFLHCSFINNLILLTIHSSCNSETTKKLQYITVTNQWTEVEGGFPKILWKIQNILISIVWGYINYDKGRNDLNEKAPLVAFSWKSASTTQINL